MKKRIGLLLILLLALALTAASAEDGGESGAGVPDLMEIEWFRDPIPVTAANFGVPAGTEFPVYGAPYENAWRGDGGEASVSTAEPFRLLGWMEKRKWLLVEYDHSPARRCVGWICPGCSLTDVEDRWFSLPSRSLLRVTKKTWLTDDPNGSRHTIAVLSPGDTVIGLCKAGDWACVETEIDGKPIWAFCRPDGLETVKLWHREGKNLVIHEGVHVLGAVVSEMVIDEYGDPEWEVITFPPGTVCLEDFGVRRDADTLVLPKSLRTSGSMRWKTSR